MLFYTQSSHYYIGNSIAPISCETTKRKRALFRILFITCTSRSNTFDVHGFSKYDVASLHMSAVSGGKWDEIRYPVGVPPYFLYRLSFMHSELLNQRKEVVWRQTYKILLLVAMIQTSPDLWKKKKKGHGTSSFYTFLILTSGSTSRKRYRSFLHRYPDIHTT